MTRLHRLALAILATVLAASAAPAFAAVKGDCLWKALPGKARDGMIEGYRAKGLEALQEVKIDDEITDALRKGCNLQPAEDYTAGEVIGAMIIENGADIVLYEQSAIPRGSLARQYQALSAADREALIVFGLAVMKSENTGIEKAGQIVFAVTGKLGLPTDSLNNHVFAYLLGRAIREAREAGRT